MVANYLKVGLMLAKDGFYVSIVQEPETSFKDDVAGVKRVLALQHSRSASWRLGSTNSGQRTPRR
jgi:hypothetical protein